MILFRADGNGTIGTGHIMRCLSLADEFKNLGRDSFFVCADSSVLELIKSRGYEVCVLSTDYSKPEEEIEILVKKPCFKEADFIIVDSYFVTKNYFAALRKAKKVIYFDDFCSDYEVNAIINYNIYADVKEYEKHFLTKKPILFLGPSYAPLRKEFSDISIRETREKAEDILILTGGADPHHIAINLINELGNRKKDNRTYHFVVGAMSSDYSQIKEFEGKLPIVIHKNVTKMSELMLKCDIAVSAAGSTLYELCSCKVPVITYTFADNQLAGAKAFSKDNIMIQIGDVRNNPGFFHDVFESIDKLAGDYKTRKEMAERGRALVDGRGAERLAKELEKLFYE